MSKGGTKNTLIKTVYPLPLYVIIYVKSNTLTDFWWTIIIAHLKSYKKKPYTQYNDTAETLYLAIYYKQYDKRLSLMQRYDLAVRSRIIKLAINTDSILTDPQTRAYQQKPPKHSYTQKKLWYVASLLLNPQYHDFCKRTD